MIEKLIEDDFRLICDHCEEEADEQFDSFAEAVAFKKEKDNGWRSVKGADEKWHDLCPSCNTPDIVLGIKAGQRL